jgi:hypothetical protein
VSRDLDVGEGLEQVALDWPGAEIRFEKVFIFKAIIFVRIQCYKKFYQSNLLQFDGITVKQGDQKI